MPGGPSGSGQSSITQQYYRANQTPRGKRRLRSLIGPSAYPVGLTPFSPSLDAQARLAKISNNDTSRYRAAAASTAPVYGPQVPETTTLATDGQNGRGAVDRANSVADTTALGLVGEKDPTLRGTFAGGLQTDALNEMINDPQQTATLYAWMQQMGYDPESPMFKRLAPRAMATRGQMDILNDLNFGDAQGDRSSDSLNWMAQQLANASGVGGKVNDPDAMLSGVYRAAQADPDSSKLSQSLHTGTNSGDIDAYINYVASAIYDLPGTSQDAILNRLDRWSREFISSQINGSIPQDMEFGDWVAEVKGGIFGAQ